MTPKYPIGIQDFAKLRDEEFIYIDKTEDIYKLLKDGKYFFLSRPRRFGKSLLLSTIKYLFMGRRELFRGLWIDSSNFDWTPRPVFHFDFANVDTSSVSSLEIHINAHLCPWERKYGLDSGQLDFSRRFYNILEAACSQSGQRCVVLIDEYDKMLVNNMIQPELHEAIRRVLRPLYSNLKSADQFIHFGMLTGGSRFAQLSLFSDLNNLLDISLDKTFATICGVTEGEMLRYFTPGIENLAATYRTDFDGIMKRLKRQYDGYHFAPESDDIYNPYSLLCALQQSKLGYFWFKRGTPTFLVQQISASDRSLSELLAPVADGISLEYSDSGTTSVTDLLFQTGYLTIKGYDWETDIYQLGIPNEEVKRGLYQSLLPAYNGKDSNLNTTLLSGMRSALMAGDANRFVEQLQSLMAGVGYDLTEKKKEIYFENNLYLILKLLGLFVTTEFKTSAGRCDVVIYVPEYVYVIELKLGRSAAEALNQINSRHYALPFTTDGRRVIKIGINISPDTRTADEWLVEE